MVPSLSVVIPVYEEPDWIGRVVDDVAAAVARAPFEDVEVVIVDDGSSAPTVEALARLDSPVPHRVIRQKNAGRFVARRTGIEAAGGDLVLLIDSRVSLHPDALRYVASEMEDGEALPVWNGHVDIDIEGNPFARFWNVMTEVAFRAYFGQPRRTSFGPEEFELFPKGTTCFLAPRDLLMAAVAGFVSAYADLRDGNDDTVLIRWIAERQRINIGPGFRCVYRSRDALLPFLRHAFHRGGVFVDGYGRPGTRFFGVVAAFFPLSVMGGLLALRRPRLVIGSAVAAAAGGGTAIGAYRRSIADGAVMGVLGPLFTLVYGAGMWRGLALAASARLGRVQASPPGPRP